MSKPKAVRKPARLQGTGQSEPSADEINKILGPVREAHRAREAWAVPAVLAPPRSNPDLLKRMLQRSGLKLDEIGQLAEEQRAKLRRLADKRMRQGLAQSKSLQAALSHGTDAQIKAAKDLTWLFPGSQLQILDRPAGISTTGGLQMDHARIQSMGSWAKVKHHLDSTDSTARELMFSYFWQNPSVDTDAVISVLSLITANGLARADDTTGFWIETHLHTILYIDVELQVFDWPVANPQDPQVSSGASRVATLDAYGPGWPECVGAIVIQNIFRGLTLNVDELVVAGGGAKIFDLVFRLTAAIDDGDIDADFSSNDFRVTSPMTMIRITS